MSHSTNYFVNHSKEDDIGNLQESGIKLSCQQSVKHLAEPLADKIFGIKRLISLKSMEINCVHNQKQGQQALQNTCLCV